ncbi:MAG: formylglycine-generating enzyme family protein [Treponema sp.]|nr:formylglycine-generating enzyme family protein [Treponema sp.]
MKKVLFTLAAIFGLSLALVATSCGGGGGGSDDDDETPVAGSGSTGTGSGSSESGSGSISSGLGSGSESTGGSGSGGGGSGSTSTSIPEGFVLVQGTTFNGTTATAVTESSVFISGRTITIPNLLACDHEVTQAEYQSVMGAHPIKFSGANRPVEYVSWYDAIMYCNKRSDGEGRTPCYKVNGNADTNQWGYTPYVGNSIIGSITCDFNANGYRLPTEAEWEYLARGGNLTNTNQTTYSGSITIGDVAWYDENAMDVGSDSPDYGTHPVKTKAKNALNLYDMSGNVFEWCWDRWSRTISASTPFDGAASGSDRVIRGGSWNAEASCCAVSCRDISFPYSRNSYCGFRVVSSRSE